jgi:hypothetical protein
MNLAERGSSNLIDDNRRRQDRTTTVRPLSNTHTPPELDYVNSIDARKKERSLCMDGARLIGSDDDLFSFFFSFSLSYVQARISLLSSFFQMIFFYLCLFFSYRSFCIYVVIDR